MIYYLIIFIIGLIIGSFLNSVIYRLDDLKTIFTHRSHCPKCQKTLAWYELVPLFSFIIQAGVCRGCKKRISWQYPVVELVTALLFLLIYLKFGFTLYTCYMLLVTCFMIVIFVYDLSHMLIANEMLLPAIIITVLFYCYLAINQHSWQPLLNALLGALVGIGFIGLVVLVTRGRGMGIGDISLAGLVGWLTGYPQVVLALFLAFLLGSAVGIFLLLRGSHKLKSAVPFGPFLILGLYLALFWGEKILNWYMKI